MSDKSILTAAVNPGEKEQSIVEKKLLDNGDGTFSEQVAIRDGATVNAIFEPDKETPTMLFRVRAGQSFTGASAGDPILAVLTINTVTNTLVSANPLWYNGNTKLQLDNADVDTAKLEVIASNSLTLSEFQTVFGNTSDAIATDPTAPSTAIQLFKAIFKWTKGARGAGNVDADTQRVAVATSPSPAVNSIAVTATSTESSFVFDANTNFILVSAGEVDSWVKVGASPVTATIGGSGCRQIFAGSTYVIPVTPGHKIAVIAAYAAGYLTVDERQ